MADSSDLTAVLTTRVRLEENLIFDALERRGIPYVHLDERRLAVELEKVRDKPYRAVVNRIMSHTRSAYAARLFESMGSPVFNSSQVIETCGDKILTNLALAQAGVPTPRTVVALGPESALDAIEQVGYPAVLKPAVGSWGRMIARINDRHAAEALIEHRQALHSPTHSVFYVQEYIEKLDGRDIRAIVVGSDVVAAIYRRSSHWITNTARGAKAEPCELTPDLMKYASMAAAAVGGGMLAVDLIERPDGELLVNEVNHTMEFHGLLSVTEVDLMDALVSHVKEAVCR